MKQLHTFTKLQLVKIIKMVGGYSGDYARESKANLIQWLEWQDEDRVKSEVINYCHILGIDPAEDDEPVTGQPIPESMPEKDAGAQLAALVAEIAGNKLDADAVAKIVDSRLSEALKSVEAAKVYVVTTPTGNKVEIPDTRHACYEEMALNYQCKINTLLVGPAGCGKSVGLEQLAEDIGVRYGSQSCSAGMSESSFAGWLLPIGDNGQFVHVSTVFLDIYENGGIFVFEELDAADANLLVFLNNAIGNGSFFLPQRHENPKVKRHVDCWIAATANTYGQGGDTLYSGRESLDAATLDRFRAGIIECDYDPKIEQAIAHPDLYAWALGIREAIKRNGLRQVMSTRFLKDATAQLAAGKTMQAIKDCYFLSWTKDEQALVN